MTNPVGEGAKVTNPVDEAVALSREGERLRQERETFDQHKLQDERWFWLRLVVGWASVVLLVSIGFIAGWIIFHPKNFSATTVSLGAGALLVDIIGVVISILRVVVGDGPRTLAPVVQFVPQSDEPAMPAAAADSARGT